MPQPLKGPFVRSAEDRNLSAEQVKDWKILDADLLVSLKKDLEDKGLGVELAQGDDEGDSRLTLTKDDFRQTVRVRTMPDVAGHHNAGLFVTTDFLTGNGDPDPAVLPRKQYLQRDPKAGKLSIAKPDDVSRHIQVEFAHARIRNDLKSSPGFSFDHS